MGVLLYTLLTSFPKLDKNPRKIAVKKTLAFDWTLIEISFILLNCCQNKDTEWLPPKSWHNTGAIQSSLTHL